MFASFYEITICLASPVSSWKINATVHAPIRVFLCSSAVHLIVHYPPLKRKLILGCECYRFIYGRRFAYNFNILEYVHSKLTQSGLNYRHANRVMSIPTHLRFNLTDASMASAQTTERVNTMSPGCCSFELCALNNASGFLSSVWKPLGCLRIYDMISVQNIQQLCSRRIY